MSDDERAELYEVLVSACQQHGFTTEHTYDLLNSAIDSISEDGEDLP